MTTQQMLVRLVEIEKLMRTTYLRSGDKKYKKNDVRNILHRVADKVTELRCDLKYPYCAVNAKKAKKGEELCHKTQ